jgi:hypothetical protein
MVCRQDSEILRILDPKEQHMALQIEEEIISEEAEN